MATIEAIAALEILDSRGNPTVEAEVRLSDGSIGAAAVPSGASTGAHEAVERRDGDERRYGGQGVHGVVQAIESEICDAVRGMDADDQAALDRRLIDLDGTPNKSRLGANAILAVSLAVARAAAASSRMPLYRYLGDEQDSYLLPVPMFNVLNGGKHAAGSVDFQEFMIVPHGAPSFSEAVRWASETYHTLGRMLENLQLPTTVGDEGGFAPPLRSNVRAPELLVQAIERAGYAPGRDISLALDPAATSFYQDCRYVLACENRTLSTQQLIELYEEWLVQFPIVSIEDGLAEDDWDGWRQMLERLGRQIQLVGDDIFVTNCDRIARGVTEKVANAVLIKLNQVGTVTETIEAMRLAQSSGWATVVSHRSGETTDTSMADLAVGTRAGQLKSGAPARGERVAKYNRLLRIERELGSRAAFGDPYRRYVRASGAEAGTRELNDGR